MAEIEVRGLRHGYSDQEVVLKSIDLTLANGEAHAVLGGSGAGKTTLLNLLAGLLQPLSGSIRFDGRDVTRLGGGARNVAQVFQFPVLYPSLRVSNNIGFALANRGWTKAAIRDRVQSLSEILDIAPLLDKWPRALSLFEKQLVAIARALARPDVAVVLLDEPLTAVEPATKWRLRRALKTVQRELGLTMVYVTHDQAEALTFAERITMLHAGRILQTSTPSEVYERPAHVEVARFIGSPGMNLVPAQVRGGQLYIDNRVVAPSGLEDGPCVVGFRPEWGSITTGDDQAANVKIVNDKIVNDKTVNDTGQEGIPVSLHAARALGTDDGKPAGLVTASLRETTLFVRQRLDGLPIDTPFARSRNSRNSRNQEQSANSPNGAIQAVPAHLWLNGDRLVTFRDGHLVEQTGANQAPARQVQFSSSNSEA